ncbi:MAG TPA: MFS transporter [Polyangiaceae bacterium]|nr:MFS transporter [Polyangiaceae bacterium]
MALSGRRAWTLALVATLAMTVSYVDRQVIAAVATSMRKALGFDAAHFGWLAGSFSAAYLVAAPLAGAVIDKVGARRGLIAAVALWSAVSAAHAFAPSFAALVALRVALAVCEAPSFPGAIQCVHRVLPTMRRSAAVGLLFTGSSLGAAIAAPLAIGIDVKLGWRAAFLLTSVAGLAWIPLWQLATRGGEARSLLAAPGSNGADKGAAVTVRWSLATNPVVLRAMALVLCSAPALMFVFLWMPQYLEIARHVPKENLPRYVWLPPVMADAGMVAFGWLSDRLCAQSTRPASGEWLVVAAGALVSCLAFATTVRDTRAAVLLVGTGALGAGALYTLLTTDMIARIPPTQVSTAGGMTAAAQSLTYVVLSPLVGWWVDRTRSFDAPLLVFGAVAVPGALAWSLARRARPDG